MSVSNIVEAISKDDNAILAVSHVLSDAFGDWAGISASLPCRVGWDGINQTLRLPMNEEEMEQMNQSIAVLKKFAIDAGVYTE